MGNEFALIIAGQTDADLVSGILDDIEFIAATTDLPPMGEAAIERIRARLTRLGVVKPAGVPSYTLTVSGAVEHVKG